MTSFSTSNLQSAPGRILTLGPAATKVVLIVVFAMLLLLYLAQSTQSATRQYDVRNLEDTVGSLEEDRAQLELEAVRLQALQAVAPAPVPVTKPGESTEEKSEPTMAAAPHVTALPNVE